MMPEKKKTGTEVHPEPEKTAPAYRRNPPFATALALVRKKHGSCPEGGKALCVAAKRDCRYAGAWI